MRVFFVNIEYKDGRQIKEVFSKYSKAKEMCDLLMGEDKEGNIKLVETKCRDIDF
ncbi:hypothetical protein ACAG39_11325 [Caldicellulosiruptoraceae bacterium PP1]